MYDGWPVIIPLITTYVGLKNCSVSNKLLCLYDHIKWLNVFPLELTYIFYIYLFINGITVTTFQIFT